MLKIRLTRRGKKNMAFFRVVVAEHTSPIKGRFIEALGFLNPHTKEKNLNVERIKYWIGKGAQCSDSVHNLLVSNGAIKGPKRAVKIKKKVEDKKETSEEKKPAEAVETEEKKEEAKDDKKIVPEKKEEKEVEKPAKEEKAEKKIEEPKPEETKPNENKEEAKEKKE